MNRRDEDTAVIGLLVLAVLLLVCIAEVVCHRHHRGGTLSWLGFAGGKEVRTIKRAPVLLMLASWYGVGCYGPSYAPPDLGDASAASYVRTLAPAGRAPLEVDALVPFDVGPRPDLQAPPAADAPPVGAEPVNVFEPLPPATVAWLAAVPGCGGSFMVAHPWDADPCEGYTRNGVRCVECSGPPPERKPLAGECQSTGACATGEPTPFLCVVDCHASCARARRYCPRGAQ